MPDGSGDPLPLLPGQLSGDAAQAPAAAREGALHDHAAVEAAERALHIAHRAGEDRLAREREAAEGRAGAQGVEQGREEGGRETAVLPLSQLVGAAIVLRRGLVTGAGEAPEQVVVHTPGAQRERKVGRERGDQLARALQQRRAPDQFAAGLGTLHEDTPQATVPVEQHAQVALYDARGRRRVVGRSAGLKGLVVRGIEKAEGGSDGGKEGIHAAKLSLRGEKPVCGIKKLSPFGHYVNYSYICTRFCRSNSP